MTVSVEARTAPAKATGVSDNRAAWSAGPRRDTRGWRRHQSGGIALHEGSTRRRHAARRLRVVQNPHHHRHGERQGHGGPGRSAREQQKPDNRTQGRPHFRYKTLPAHPPSPHIRYKTLPAHPPSPHIRYKTLPAHPKWLNLALFLHAGRVLYRSHHQEAKQGELCTVLTTKKPSRANCVPNARQRSSEPTQQHSLEGSGFFGPFVLRGLF